MNKKAYVYFISIILLSIFSILCFEILKNIQIKQNSKNKEILYKQAHLHLQFLQEYLKKYPLENVSTLLIDDPSFIIEAKKNTKETDLFVHYKKEDFSIGLHKKIFP